MRIKSPCSVSPQLSLFGVRYLLLPSIHYVTDDDGGPSPLHTKGGGGGDAAAPETGLLSWPGTVESENHFSALYV